MAFTQTVRRADAVEHDLAADVRNADGIAIGADAGDGAREVIVGSAEAQGAATGVGGILRDIIAMGARPVALLDALRFGAPDDHFSRAVAGIGAYGNSVGVPNVGGEVVFDGAYASNCLVNAMCVGLLPVDRVMRAKADTAGALLVLFGATTGRDGIGGASVLASQELGDEPADKRPTVQVGDPFTGKRLIEVSVELVERGLVLSLQDCGAAGLASSLSEMAADYGIDVHLDRVPQREADMEPWEIMISESQERMVAIVAPDRLGQVEAVIDRWELHRSVIGEVTETGELRALWDGDIVGAIPARTLTEYCPRYAVECDAADGAGRTAGRGGAVRGGRAPRAARLGSAPFTSVRVPALRPARAVAHGAPAGTGRRRATAAAVLSRARRDSRRNRPGRVAGSLRRRRARSPRGRPQCRLRRGEPLGFTDCLNFGNPEKAEIGWELTQSIEGMAQACEALGLPVVSGNVSLYNDTDGRSIPPTPVVGCVGLVPDVRRIPGAWREGDTILLASAGSPVPPGLGVPGSIWHRSGAPAVLELAAEAELIRFLAAAATRCSLAHDVAAGGLAVALAEAALHSGLGADSTLGSTPRCCSVRARAR